MNQDFPQASPAVSTTPRRKRVLVTGAGGFIGSHLCEALLARDHEVIGLDGFPSCSYDKAVKLRNLSGCLPHPRFSFVRADLRIDELRPLLEGIDVVVNEAAMPGLPKSWTDFESYLSCNVTAVQRLLEASRRAGVTKFVQASTSSVYGVDAIGDEHQPTRPISPYGVTKLAAEHLLMSYVQTCDFPAIILRYFSIYGPRQRPDMAYHIFIDRISRGQPIVIYGDGQQSRSNTYVDDCVLGTILAMGKASIGETYNIGGGQAITLRGAVDVLAESLRLEPKITYAPPRLGDQRHTAADFSKARSAFGYAPTVSPQIGLRIQASWQSTTGQAAVTTAEHHVA